MRSRLKRVAAWGRRSRAEPDTARPPDPSILGTLDSHDRAVIDQARPYTMTSVERLVATMDAVGYVTQRGIRGDFVECGVWRGGSVLAMILTLQHLGVQDRDLYLYDTFEGMTAPGEHDTSQFDEPALKTWSRARAAGQTAWDYFFRSDDFGVEHVRQLLLGTGYPPERIHFEVGPVERTLPKQAPEGIALLRLDTDWYESTKHELVHLYPRLADGGVLIIDDYGHWEGCRRAVDEYFSQLAPRPLLGRIDYTGRLAIKH